MSRIELHDSGMDMIMKMSDGNPGAVNAIMGLVQAEPTVDPQSIWQGFGTLLSLDTLEIYGSSIYILANDKCGGDVRKFILLIRAFGHGFIAGSKIQAMAADQMRQLNLTDEEFADLDRQVCEALTEFQKPTGEENEKT